jgi:membrane AbrB-like protein
MKNGAGAPDRSDKVHPIGRAGRKRTAGESARWVMVLTARAAARRLGFEPMAWAAVAAVVGWVLDLAGLPSAALFGALVVGLVLAIAGLPRGRPPLTVPAPASTAAQAVLGVLTGALVQPDTLRTLSADWLPVLASVLATLLVSVLGGLVLGLRRDVDRVTGSFALIAGGASGLTAISRELGADQRVVAVVQYLRVLVILAVMPLVATALPAGSGATAIRTGPAPPLWADLALTAGCGLAGVALARLTRLPAGALLGPMVLTAVLAATGLTGSATVPGPLLQVAYAVIGLDVGLSFTRESLRSVRRLLPAALAVVVALTAATAAIGIPLLALAGASVLDGYLATTPGGLFAVLATAVSTGADTTLVLAVQVLRLAVMLALAPVLAVLLGRRASGRS